MRVKGGSVESGFAKGTIRDRSEVKPFSITKFPVSRDQYAECVEAGACAAVEEHCLGSALTTGRVGAEGDAPATCVLAEEAGNYCSWVGGRLPTLGEWLLAARGRSPQRFAWGSSAPTCDQHAHAAQYERAVFAETGEADYTACAADRPSNAIGAHSAGAAASGLEDALLTPAELLASDAASPFPACSDTFSSCVVFGLLPGAIDAVAPVIGDRNFEASVTDQPRLTRDFGFRCAWGEE